MTTAYSTQTEKLAGLQYGPLTGRVGSWEVPLAAGLEFGTLAFSYPGERKVYPFIKDTATLVFSGDLVTSNSTIVTVNGVATTATVFATNHLTTMGLIIDKLNALTGVEALLDATDTNNRTILIRTRGATTTASAAVTLGAGQATASATYASGQIFVGAVLRTTRPYSGVAKYNQYETANILERGQLYVTAGTACDANMPCKVSTTGVVGNTGTSINARFRSTTSGADLVILEVNGQTSFGSAELL